MLRENQEDLEQNNSSQQDDSISSQSYEEHQATQMQASVVDLQVSG